MQHICFAFLAVCLLIAPFAFAAEKTITAKVKSVDAAKNSIKLDDLELDVTRKTKIDIDGKKAALTDIKPGQQVKVTYDDTLEAAISIVNSDSNEATFKKTGCRVVWTISESGDSTLLISRPLESRPKATDSLIRHDDGTVEFQHGFATEESVVKTMMGNGTNVEFDKSRKAIVMIPKVEKGYDYPVGHFTYSKIAKLPLTIEYEFEFTEPSGGMTFGLNVRNRRIGNTEFPVLNISSDNDLKDSAKIHAFFHAGRDDKGKSKFTQLLDESVGLNEPKEFNFKIPLKVDDAFLPEFGKAGVSHAALQFVSVRGHLVPTMGLGLAEKNGAVIAEKVFPKGLAETVGIRADDVLMGINGKKPATMKEALELLGKIKFGEESEIVVKRNGKTVKIGFTAE
jgi:hypothetical protein